MIKRIIYLFIAFTCMTAMTSCELESNVYDAYNTNIFPNTEEDVEALLVGSVYGPFRSNQFSGLFTVAIGGVQIYNDMCTDLGDCNWNDPYWFDIINVNFNLNNSNGPQLIYNNWLSSLSRMADVIKRVKEMDSISETNKQKLLAQCYCGVGWLGYILYDMYGGIQIPTEESLANPAAGVIIPRSSNEETAKFIEENLLEAAKYLPKNIKYGSADYGRFTAGTAYTVLMHLYMHDGRWKDAAEIGKELMKSEYGYKLVPNYKDIFTLENEGNSETIFACTCDHGIHTQYWLSQVLTDNYPVKNKKMQRWGGYRMPWNFYHTYEKGDRRLETIVASYTSTSGVLIDEAHPGSQLRKGAMPKKYGEDPEDTGAGSAIDWIVLRYADVLLLQAEALARSANNVTQEAVDRLNDIRRRAGLDEYSVGDFSSLDSFLSAVLTERGHELYFEGWRRSDLIRHGKFVTYAKFYKKSLTAAPHHVLFPLPQSVIMEGHGQVIQNPGY